MQHSDVSMRPVSGIEALNYVRTADDAAKIVVYYQTGDYRLLSEREIQAEFMLRSMGLVGEQKERERAKLLAGGGYEQDYGFERFEERPKPYNPYRRIDDLGRIVMPSLLRKELDIFNKNAQFRMDHIHKDAIMMTLVDKGEEIL